MSKHYRILVELTDEQVQALEELTQMEKSLFPDAQMGRGSIPDDEYVLVGAIGGLCEKELATLIKRALTRKKKMLSAIERMRTSDENGAHPD